MTSVIYQVWVEKIQKMRDEQEATYVEIMEQTPVDNPRTAGSGLAMAIKHGQWPSFRVLWALETMIGGELTQKAADEKLASIASSKRANAIYARGLQYRDQYRGKQETPEQRKMRKEVQRRMLYEREYGIEMGYIKPMEPEAPENLDAWLAFYDEIRAATGRGTPYNRKELCRSYGFQPQYINHLLTRKRVPTSPERKQKLESMSQEVLGHGIEEE